MDGRICINFKNYTQEVQFKDIKTLVELKNFIREKYNITNDFSIHFENKEIQDEKAYIKLIQKRNIIFTIEFKSFDEFFEAIDITSQSIIGGFNKPDITDKILFKFNEKCDSCNISPIINTKYTCLICSNMVLCSNCEASHDEHPVIKLKNNDYNKDLNNILTYSATQKFKFPYFETLFKNGFDLTSLISLSNVQLNAKLECPFEEMKLKPKEKSLLAIIVYNTGVFPIPKDTSFKITNTFKSLVIQPTRGLSADIPKGGHASVEFELEVNEALESVNCLLELSLIHTNLNITSTKVSVVVNVEVENPVIDFINKNTSNAEIKTLTLEKKELLMNIINDNVVSNSLESIYFAMKKTNWDLNEAMNNLYD